MSSERRPAPRTVSLDAWREDERDGAVPVRTAPLAASVSEPPHSPTAYTGVTPPPATPAGLPASTPPPAPPPPGDGAQLVGRYRVEAQMGAGSTGVVYKAFDAELQRTVALKLLAPSVSTQAHHRERLMKEARAMAQLSHPNVAIVYEVGEHRGQLFIAMELLEGGTPTVRPPRQPGVERRRSATDPPPRRDPRGRAGGADMLLLATPPEQGPDSEQPHDHHRPGAALCVAPMAGSGPLDVQRPSSAHGW